MRVLKITNKFISDGSSCNHNEFYKNAFFNLKYLFNDYVKSVSKCASIESKNSKAVLKLIFLTKENEIRRLAFSSKKMLNKAFHFHYFQHYK